MVTRWRRRCLRPLVAGLLVLAATVGVLRRTFGGTPSVPLHPHIARWRVGAAYLDRNDVPTTGARRGQLESLDTYARPGFDPGRIHPEVRRFYERTAAYDLAYDVTWHRGFRIGAALASRLTGRIEQLNLPGPGESTPRTLRSRFVGIDDRDCRLTGSRAWIRTDPSTGEAVFVAVYGFYRKDGVTYENVAVPLPRTNLSTVLYVDALETGTRPGLELTTRTATGDEGLYLATPWGAVPLPLDQTFRVRPADAPDAPHDVTGGEATVVATHEMWLLGRKFLTVHYAAVPDERTDR